MKRRISFVLILVLLSMLVALPAIAEEAAADSSEQAVVIDSTGNYLSAWNDVTVSDAVSGDVLATGQYIQVMADVGGDVLAAGQTIDVTGNVADDVRIAGQTIRVRSSVGKNAMLFGQTITTTDSTVIGKSLYAFGAVITVRGEAGAVSAFGETVDIGGVINGDLYIEANTVKISPSAKVNGNLKYKSEKEITVPAGVVAGEVEFVKVVPTTTPTPEASKGFNIVSRLLGLVSILVIAALALWIFKPELGKVATLEPKKAAIGTAIGLGLLAGLPVLFLVLMITVIGIPLALISGVLYIIMLYLAIIPAGAWLGNLILKNSHLILQGMLGIVIIKLVTWIPVIGGFVTFITILFGLGLYFNCFLEYRRRMKPAVEKEEQVETI